MRTLNLTLSGFAVLGTLAVFFWTDSGLAINPKPECPQPRFTKKAPADIYNLKNPLEANAEHVKNGKLLYMTKAKPMACKHCHGVEGDGHGPMARGFSPPPRNFTCAETINGVPDGQLFWIIKNGSPGTGMMAYSKMPDEKVWEVILFLRQLAQKS